MAQRFLEVMKEAFEKARDFKEKDLEEDNKVEIAGVWYSIKFDTDNDGDQVVILGARIPNDICYVRVRTSDGNVVDGKMEGFVLYP